MSRYLVPFAFALLSLTVSASADTPDAATMSMPPAAQSMRVDVAVPDLGDCCRVIVKGCSKQAKVCVPGDCNLANQKKARNAYESAYNCKSTSVSSYIGTCSGEKCELDLR